MPQLRSGAPARAPGVELLGELQGSGYHEAPALVRRGDGQTLQVTPLLYSLLDALDGRRDLAELAEELGRRCGKLVTRDDVQYLLQDKLAPLGLLETADGSAPHVEKSTPLLGLKLKVVVSDPAVTQRVTTPFAWLFRRWVVVPSLLAFAVTCWWVLWEKGLASATRQAFETPGLLLAVFAITVLSAGWHEFGHAAACRAAGATPGAMGAGLYLVWPAFYTDVDDCYRLSRWGRLMVDLGGLYFNALLAVGAAVTWALTRQDAVLLLVATQLLLMVRQLAPVIRADGYHILADLTGVPDLFKHIGPTLAGLLPQNWGRPQPLQRWAAWVVRIWVLVVVPLLLWLLVLAVLLLPRLVATAWAGLRDTGGSLGRHSESGDALGLLADVLQGFALVLPVAAVTYLLVRLSRSVAGAVWARTRESPLMRAGAVLMAAALAALAAWAWWPSGQYQPVRADERGTLGALTSVSAVQGTSFRPIDGAVPTTAYALVPRSGDGPTLLLVRATDGSLRSVLADGASRTGVAFPFALPDPARIGDNQALAVNTGDGTVVYDVAVALVWMKDGEVADNRNEAYALASCTGCTTVAVAFQVVLVVGQSEAVAPVNAAVAANGGCVECSTTALAVQLVVTLREMPSGQVQQQIEEALAGLEDLKELPDPYASVKDVEKQILQLLTDNGLLEQEESTTQTAQVSASPTASPSATGTPSSSERTSQSAYPTASASSSPDESAEPTATGTSTPTSSAAPERSEDSPSPSPSASG